MIVVESWIRHFAGMCLDISIVSPDAVDAAEDSAHNSSAYLLIFSKHTGPPFLFPRIRKKPVFSKEMITTM